MQLVICVILIQFSILSYIWNYILSLFQNGQTPLLLAAEKGHFGIVRELLHRNASVNARDEVIVD